MLTTHKISAELYFETFDLIAVHATLEDYTMAYTLNKLGRLHLKRSDKDLDFGKGASFSFFEWMDEVSDTHWTLFANHCKSQQSNSGAGLFLENVGTITHHLVAERKEVDYFLKIETDQKGLVDKMVEKVIEIPNIVTAYSIDANTLKSKKNLIF